MSARHKTAEPPALGATYRDVINAPPHMVAEVVTGELHTHPRPAMRHAWAGARIQGKLDAPFNSGRDGPGGWWIVFEPELHLGPEVDQDILVPDLAGWRRKTMPEFPDTAFCTVTPDWVCEVLSPSTRQLDRGGKRMAYAREGVSHLWFVDPDARMLEAFALREGQWVLIATLADDEPVSVPPFEAITFSLADLWPDRGGSGPEGGEG